MTDTIVDTQDAHKQLIAEAKALGIKQAHLMKPETLEKRIEEATARPTKNKAKLDVSVPDFGAKYLKSIGFDYDWLLPLANQYNIDKFEYLHKFKAFRAYRGEMHVDWVSVNDVSIYSGKREICEILLKHSNVDKSRRVFDFNWRI